MNIFIDKETFFIRKIEKAGDGWILHPVEKDKDAVFISREFYSGKMPPFFRWPWQKLKLEITKSDGFLISAKLNEVLLFEISEDDYPPEVKAKVEKGRKLMQKMKEEAEKEDAEIKAALAEYLQKFTPGPNLEDEMASLHICFRAYLKLHFFCGEQNEDYRRRIALMLLLCRVAERFCKRRLDLSSAMNVALFEWGFVLSCSFYFNLLGGYRTDVREFEKSNDSTDVKKLFSEYYELEQLVEESFPMTENVLLKRYLVYAAHKIVIDFLNDCGMFLANQSTTLLGKRLLTDNEDYRRSVQKMRLLKFKSFILPEVFPEEKIKDFVYSYNI